jgi:carboxylesterase type B
MPARLCARLLAVFALVATALVAPTGAAWAADPQVVTPAGTVVGTTDGAVESFLGIPYAKPPVGALRFRPAEPHPSWSGPRNAKAYGAACPQLATVNGPEQSSTEDCLKINVQRPAAASATPRPVLVVIHGGAFIHGNGGQYDGAPFVRANDAVVVTLNYRLGVFGFLSVPALTDEPGNVSAGNWGFTDQQLALQWVKNSIASFGGDPNKITLAGSSSGAMAVCAHLAAPLSKDLNLFSAASISSGSCISRTRLSSYNASSGPYVQACGLVEPALTCLRSRSVKQLLDAYGKTTATLPIHESAPLPEDVAAAIAAGRFHKVPVIIGANRDEGRETSKPASAWTETDYKAALDVMAGVDDSDEIYGTHYPWSSSPPPNTAAELLGAVLTDDGPILKVGGCATRTLTDQLARHTTVFAYEFAHRSGPGLQPAPAGYELGASHSAELPYLFPSYYQVTDTDPPTPSLTPPATRFLQPEKDLSQDMTAWWGAFVKHRNPGAVWPQHTVATPSYLHMLPSHASVVRTDAQFRAAHTCDYWNSVDLFSGAEWAVVLAALGLNTHL